MTNKGVKSITEKITRVFFNVMFCAARGFSPTAIAIISRILSTFTYHFARKQRRVALNNIKFALNKNTKDAKNLLKKNLNIVFQDALELLHYYHLSPEAQRKLYRISNKAIIDRTLSYKQGLIAVTAHLGKFPFICRALYLEGYHASFVIRNLRDKKLGAVILDMAEYCNVRLIWAYPRKVCVRKCLEVLEKNEILILLLDQNFGSGGVFVSFFNRAAATATGPVVLAKRTGAKIVPMFINRDDFGVQEIIIEDIYKLLPSDDPEEFIKQNIQQLTKIIENYVKKYPLNWNWIHNRWKARPPLPVNRQGMTNDK
ncbi:MAG: lysophospholipid acyltransferase family protein [Candidatus Omnitrophota bacterium]